MTFLNKLSEQWSWIIKAWPGIDPAVFVDLHLGALEFIELLADGGLRGDMKGRNTFIHLERRRRKQRGIKASTPHKPKAFLILKVPESITSNLNIQTISAEPPQQNHLEFWPLQTKGFWLLPAENKVSPCQQESAWSRAYLLCGRSRGRACSRRTRGNAGSSWPGVRPPWVSGTAGGRINRSVSASHQPQTAWASINPDLSGEPPFDLESLQPSVHFVLGCRRKNKRHSMRGASREHFTWAAVITAPLCTRRALFGRCSPPWLRQAVRWYESQMVSCWQILAAPAFIRGSGIQLGWGSDFQFWPLIFDSFLMEAEVTLCFTCSTLLQSKNPLRADFTLQLSFIRYVAHWQNMS